MVEASFSHFSLGTLIILGSCILDLCMSVQKISCFSLLCVDKIVYHFYIMLAYCLYIIFLPSSQPEIFFIYKYKKGLQFSWHTEDI